MKTIDELLEPLRKEIETLRAQTQISPEAWHCIREMDSILFGFGFYDPASDRDHELWRMLEPHMKALKVELGLTPREPQKVQAKP